MAVAGKVETKASTKLRMVECGGCRAKVFINGQLAPFETVPCSKCGHPVMVPVRLRQFELQSIIGSGGMGTVYRAHDLMLERQVAVKLMRKELVNDNESLQNFIREARTCAALNHTNIIHVYTFDQYEDQYYLVMELADCGSMDQRIEKESRLPELSILDIGIKVASALDTALKHGLLHRDIKPGNILFNAEGEPKLIDFGLAGSADVNLAHDGTIWGTVRYVAPEKIQRQGETFLSDMYSLGATLYHGLTGHVPFEAESDDAILMAHVSMEATPPDQVVPDVTHATSEAIMRMLAKSPVDRFQTYDELIMALTAARTKLLFAKYHTPHVEI
ncbi:serine/threonine-protein kinase [Fontisphaera persica]|uniref:serine/threonine-protein kinase n=1 Tax=Fontisphaera persica TaxID=2974023 RepID=UPI0024C0A2DB|nr:serine/threonine-protein kinase [Fontisphaera persica]WCJ59374.1 serine/threonine-protein kinase [Fontisphaera persica]